MKKSQGGRVAGATTQEGRRRTAMPVILHNVPSGHDWGWYSREDPRMHIQLLGKSFTYKVWLEERGKRVFQPVGKIPAKVLKSLKATVEERRTPIEDMWVRFMLDKEWLDLHVALPKVTLVAYPKTPNKFTRVIDLSTWFNEKQLATLTPDIITLDREMAALRIWSDRSEEQVPYDARLSSLLWKG